MALMRKTRLIPLIALLLAAGASAEDAAAVLSTCEQASGGIAWRQVTTLSADGTLVAGGLRGDYHQELDLATGRSADSYQLGSVEGGDGFDGTTAWSRDPGGEIAALDTPEAVRLARSEAWLDARAYWFPTRGIATYGPVEIRDLDGRRYRVLTATPQGGEPLSLWIDADTNLLTRIALQDGADLATTLLADYRDVDGVKLPFHVITDLTDVAGRTDPRRRTEVQFTRMILNAPLDAQHFKMPVMSPTARIDEPGGATQLSFDLKNNHIYIDATVDAKPVRFLVDTGGANLLTPAAAQRLGLLSEGKMAIGGTGEERADLGLARARELRVAGAVLENPVFLVVDLGVLPKVEGVALDGLVGYEVFRRFAVQIDYANRELHLYDPAAFTAPSAATALPFHFADHDPVVSGSLDGLPGQFSIDTGARNSLTLDSAFVRTHDLVRRYDAPAVAITGWGVGGPARSHPARLGTLRLGDLAIDGIAGDLYTGDKGSFANPELAGNLGGGVLRRFTVTFDYAHQIMYLQPNAEFGKADSFDRSGLWLFAEGNVLKVVDVAKRSAAARSLIRDGDEITSIDGQRVTAKPLADWRTLLRERPAGTSLRVAYRRHGKPREVLLVLADRITTP